MITQLVIEPLHIDEDNEFAGLSMKWLWPVCHEIVRTRSVLDTIVVSHFDQRGDR